MKESLTGWIVLAIIITIGWLIYSSYIQQHAVTSAPIQNSYYQSPSSDSSNYASPYPTIDTCDSVTQYYYYCWNTGNPNPHHYGHHVYGDHLCTNRELGRC